ncbi:uncharacterized protein [Anabrus simplex]|uniref:uncharacterized protein isoform X2 n=1 Tax=Anabrus simplex TaxID=316456 RepID=UPI0035A351A9
MLCPGGMMETNNILFTFFIVFGVVLTNHICLSYLNYTMDAGKVCSPFKNNTLKLGAKYNEHGIVISETSRFNYWFGRKISKCRFEVKEHRKNKIVAVIQKLSFRQDESGNCTDYVQFKSGTEESEKFCGFIRAMHSGTYPMDPDIPASNIAPNAFVVHDEGKLDVIIYVANKKLHPEEELDLEIVFTSARDCPSASHEYSVCGYNLCIRREFLKDGFVNCPFVNCPDEDGCYRSIPVKGVMMHSRYYNHFWTRSTDCELGYQ